MLAAYELALTSARSTSVSGYTARDGGELLLSREDLIVGMRALAKARDTESAVEVLLRMVEDAQEVFGYEMGKEEWTAVVVGLFRAGRDGEAMEKIREVRAQGGEVDLSEVLSVVTREAYGHTKEVWKMISGGHGPTDADWKQLFDYLRRGAKKRMARAQQEIEIVARRAVEGDHPYGPLGHTARLRALLAAGDTETVTREKRSTATDDGTAVTPLKAVLKSRDEWLLELEYAHHVGEQRTLMEVCKEMTDTEYEVPQKALRWLVLERLRDGAGLEEAVSYVETELACAIGPKAFSKIMKDRYELLDRTLSPSQRLRQIEQWNVEVYRLTRRRGVEIDWNIAEAVIGATANASSEALDVCFEIFADALRNDDAIATRKRERQLTKVLRYLTSACAESDPPRSTAARDLLEQAAAMGIDKAVAQPELVKLIEGAPDHDVAYEIYAYYHRVNAVDEELFNRIVNAFIGLSPKGSDFVLPPADLLLEIVKNMKMTDIEPGAHVFTTLVTRYGWLASQKRGVPYDVYSRRLVALQTAVSDIHNRIKLDSGITVDVPLLNALLDAYNRIGQPDIALTIWNDLVDRRSRTDPAVAKSQYPTSVSLAMDLCSHHGMEARLRRIWAWARRHGFAETPKTWNGYVEALCRLGHYEEATDVAVRQMKGRVDGAPAPVVETVKILLKFGWKAGPARKAIVDAVKSELPDLWDRVKHTVASKEERER